MAKPRKRYSPGGRPLSCGIVIPPDLAVYLYAAKRELSYRDETELVCAIVREWAKARAKPDWAALVKELDAEARAEGDVT